MNGFIIELKKEIITKDTLSEILLKKQYLTKYARYCKERKVRLGRCVILFVAPLIDAEAVEYAKAINENMEDINGIEIRVVLTRLGDFIELIYEKEIDKEQKWFFVKALPSISKPTDYVAQLIDLGLARII